MCIVDFTGPRFSGNLSVKASTSVSFDTDDEIHYIDVGSPSSSLEPDGIFHKPPRSPTSSGMGLIPKGKVRPAYHGRKTRKGTILQ